MEQKNLFKQVPEKVSESILGRIFIPRNIGERLPWF